MSACSDHFSAQRWNQWITIDNQSISLQVCWTVDLISTSLVFLRSSHRLFQKSSPNMEIYTPLLLQELCFPAATIPKLCHCARVFSPFLLLLLLLFLISVEKQTSQGRSWASVVDASCHVEDWGSGRGEMQLKGMGCQPVLGGPERIRQTNWQREKADWSEGLNNGVEEVESCDGSPGSAFILLSPAAVQEQRDYQRSRGYRIQPRGQVGATNASAALPYVVRCRLKYPEKKTDLLFTISVQHKSQQG